MQLCLEHDTDASSALGVTYATISFEMAEKMYQACCQLVATSIF